MRWVLFYMRAFIFALIVSTPVMAGDADDIENTIRSQFEAFQRESPHTFRQKHLSSPKI
jgi:hypothetical protein